MLPLPSVSMCPLVSIAMFPILSIVLSFNASALAITSALNAACRWSNVNSPSVPWKRLSSTMSLSSPPNAGCRNARSLMPICDLPIAPWNLSVPLFILLSCASKVATMESAVRCEFGIARLKSVSLPPCLPASKCKVSLSITAPECSFSASFLIWQFILSCRNALSNICALMSDTSRWLGLSFSGVSGIKWRLYDTLL